jgi:hypothetical protein
VSAPELKCRGWIQDVAFLVRRCPQWEEESLVDDVEFADCSPRRLLYCFTCATRYAPSELTPCGACSRLWPLEGDDGTAPTLCQGCRDRPHPTGRCVRWIAHAHRVQPGTAVRQARFRRHPSFIGLSRTVVDRRTAELRGTAALQSSRLGRRPGGTYAAGNGGAAWVAPPRAVQRTAGRQEPARFAARVWPSGHIRLQPGQAIGQRSRPRPRASATAECGRDRDAYSFQPQTIARGRRPPGRPQRRVPRAGSLAASDRPRSMPGGLCSGYR